MPNNTLLTDQHIVNEALMILENDLTFTKQVDRQLDSEFKNAKRGATISVRKAPKYVLRDGQTAVIQATTQTQVPFTLSHQFGVDVEFYSSDLALSISDFGRDILAPQISVIANGIDWAGMQCALQVANAVGTPATTPGTGMTAQQTLGLYLQAGALLDKNAIPRDGQRAAVVNEDAQAILVANLSGVFQDATSVSQQYKTGTMGVTAGAKFSMDQNTNVMTIGSLAGTILVNGAGQSQILPPGVALGQAGFVLPTINLKGMTASTLIFNGGERFTLPTVNGVNPANLQNTGKLQVFVVMGPVTSTAGGLATVPMWPPIQTAAAGAYQTVTAAPADGAPLTFFGAAGQSAVQNVLFHKTAFTFASVDLPLPGGVHMAARKSDKRLGVSLRFVAAYLIATDQYIGRFDCLCGWLCQRPEAAVVIYG